ncbi:hypothetical protein B0H13DRAFT_1618935 [Mycena leptocephala]|nr:hypothetical protein B0H13DRAFT_1618935 [Mycena leptocephala]
MGHYSSLFKIQIADLEFGDSLHLPAPPDLLAIVRWVFAGLPGFEPPPTQKHITAGIIDRQTTLGGRGSCGIAATNFIEFRIDMNIPRWMSDQSAEFRDAMLQDLILYHIIARRQTTVSLLVFFVSCEEDYLHIIQTYQDWVTPCALVANGEIPGFHPDLAIGYNDFNLDKPNVCPLIVDYSTVSIIFKSASTSHPGMGRCPFKSAPDLLDQPVCGM